MVNFIKDQLWVDNDTGANDGKTGWVENPGGDQVEREGTLSSLDRVAGIRSTIGPDDDSG
jgi:hypothetical protein